MISRVADHCFWLGRYLERAEATARLLAVTRNLALDAGLPARDVWRPVVIVAGEEPRFAGRFGEEAAGDGGTVQHYLTWDEENPSSIVRSIGAARENARSIREVVSLEVWEAVNELHLFTSGPVARSVYELDRHGFYARVRRSCQLVAGLLRSTMLHEPPLQFIWLGKLLERVGQTARVVDVHHHALTFHGRSDAVVDTALWLALLRACSGFEPFMKRSHGRVTGEAVASFLIFEPLFPKSVAYAVHAAGSRFRAIRPPEAADLPGGRSQARLTGLEEWLAERQTGFQTGEVHELLTRVVDETAEICGELGTEMLGYGPVPSHESAQ